MNNYAKLAVFISVLLLSVSLMSVAIEYLGDLSKVDFKVQLEQDLVPSSDEPGETINLNKERIRVKGVPRGVETPLFEIWNAPLTQYLRWTVGEKYEDGLWTRYEWHEPLVYHGEDIIQEVSLASDIKTVSYFVHPLFNLTTFIPTTLNVKNINFDNLVFRYPSLQIYTSIESFISPYEVTFYLYDFVLGAVTDAQIRYNDEYQNVPDELRTSLYRMARNITEGYDSPYDRLKRIEGYLRDNFDYGADFEPAPENVDPIEWFLFNQTKGTCSHFNSAFVLLARSIGLPVRIVAGYLMDPDVSYQRIMPSNGHMWAEAYFQNIGWLTFDATPERYNEKPIGKKKIPTITEILYNPDTAMKDDYFSVSGTVKTDNGTNVSGLVVEIYLKVNKNETGYQVGKGQVSDGLYQITCKTKSDMEVGDYHLVAKTLPNEIYKGSDSDPDLRLMTRSEVSINAPKKAYVGEAITISGTLLDSTNDAPIVNETLSINIDDEVFHVSTSADGQISVIHTFKTEGDRNVSIFMNDTRYILGSNTSFGVAVSMKLPPQPSILQVLTTFPYNIMIITFGTLLLIGGVILSRREKALPISSENVMRGETELDNIDLDSPLQYESYKEGIVKLFNRFYVKNQRRYNEVTESMTPREFQNTILRKIPASGTQALDYLVTAFEIADYSTSKPTKEMFEKCEKAIDILEDMISHE